MVVAGRSRLCRRHTCRLVLVFAAATVLLVALAALTWFRPGSWMAALLAAPTVLAVSEVVRTFGIRL